MSQNPQQPIQPQTGRKHLKFAGNIVLWTAIGALATLVVALVTFASFVFQFHLFGIGNTPLTSLTTPASTSDLQCPYGTLQTHTAIQTKVQDVPNGSALVVTLPTASDFQTVVLFSNLSDLNAYVCLHKFTKSSASHAGPELLVLHEEGRSSVDLILYQGSPTIDVVPNTQTNSEISNFKQRYSDVCVNEPNHCVYEYTNHQQSNPYQQSIP